MKQVLKKVFKKKSHLIYLINKICLGNKCKYEKGNKVKIERLLKKSKIEIHGKNNLINIDYIDSINNINIFIKGDNNKISIGRNVLCKETFLWLEDNNNSIEIKDNSTFAGKIKISAIEGTKVKIGEYCLFSDNINIMSGDAHSILNKTGERINLSKDISIANHVWCGNDVQILKGSVISANSVIGGGSIVTKKFETPNVVIAGVPAKIRKKEISWKYERN